MKRKSLILFAALLLLTVYVHAAQDVFQWHTGKFISYKKGYKTQWSVIMGKIDARPNISYPYWNGIIEGDDGTVYEVHGKKNESVKGPILPDGEASPVIQYAIVGKQIYYKFSRKEGSAQKVMLLTQDESPLDYKSR